MKQGTLGLGFLKYLLRHVKLNLNFCLKCGSEIIPVRLRWDVQGMNENSVGVICHLYHGRTLGLA